MSHAQDRLSLKRAFGISTVLHLMLAPLFVTTATLAVGSADFSAGTGAAETTRVSYLTLERRVRAPIHPAAPAHPVASAARPERVDDRPRPAPARAAVAARKLPEKAPSPEGAVADSTHAARGRLPGALARIALSLATAAPERQSQPDPARVASPEPARVTTHDAASVAPAPVSSTAPQAQVVEASARGMDVPPGGWGQTFDKPLVADEAALAELRSRYHAASSVTVEVDEGGRATHISLPAGLSDEARAELEKRLRELRYVPAECNGLRCGGTLQILI